MIWDEVQIGLACDGRQGVILQCDEEPDHSRIGNDWQLMILVQRLDSKHFLIRPRSFEIADGKIQMEGYHAPS